MRLGIHVPEIAKTPATIGHDKQRTSCGIHRQISLVPWLFLVEPGYEAICGARRNGPVYVAAVTFHLYVVCVACSKAAL